VLLFDREKANMPGRTKKLMQKRRFVKRLHEEKQAEDTTGRREQFNPNDEEFFKDEVDIFHEKREMALDRSGLLEPADSSSEDDEVCVCVCVHTCYVSTNLSLYSMSTNILVHMYAYIHKPTNICNVF
jgi:hypothetical protein